MKHLLLVAHGSRRPESNTEIAALAARLQDVAGESYAGISHAFLELAEPSIPAAIDDCVSAGSNEVVILPYFLAAGRHVIEDIPEIIAAKQSEYPQVCLRITGHFGTADELPGLLLALAGR